MSTQTYFTYVSFPEGCVRNSENTSPSEAKAKVDAQSSRDNLRKDLQALHEVVKVARKALSDAIAITKSTLGGSTNGQ